MNWYRDLDIALTQEEINILINALDHAPHYSTTQKQRNQLLLNRIKFNLADLSISKVDEITKHKEV